MLRKQRHSSCAWFCCLFFFLIISSSGIVSIKYNFPLAHCFHGLLVGAQQQVVVSHQAFRAGFPASCFVLVNELDAVVSSCYFTCFPVPSKWKYQLLIQGWTDVWGSCCQNVSGIRSSFVHFFSPTASVLCIGKELFPYSTVLCLQMFFCRWKNCQRQLLDSLTLSRTRKIITTFFFFLICLL